MEEALFHAKTGRSRAFFTLNRSSTGRQFFFNWSISATILKRPCSAPAKKAAGAKMHVCSFVPAVILYQQFYSAFSF